MTFVFRFSIMPVMFLLAASTFAETVVTNWLIAHYPFNGATFDVIGFSGEPLVQNIAIAPDRFRIDEAAINCEGHAADLNPLAQKSLLNYLAQR